MNNNIKFIVYLDRRQHLLDVQVRKSECESALSRLRQGFKYHTKFINV